MATLPSTPAYAPYRSTGSRMRFLDAQKCCTPSPLPSRRIPPAPLAASVYRPAAALASSAAPSPCRRPMGGPGWQGALGRAPRSSSRLRRARLSGCLTTLHWNEWAAKKRGDRLRVGATTARGGSRARGESGEGGRGGLTDGRGRRRNNRQFSRATTGDGDNTRQFEE